MKISLKWLAAISGIGLLMVFLACNKESNSGSASIPSGQSKMSVYLMDGPFQYYKVLIDIRQVAIKIDTAMHQSDADDDREWDNDWKNSIWDTLQISPGIYDLLSLRNGVDTLLATGNYPSGKVLKVRITLGSDNTFFTDSLTSYPLVVFGPNPYFDINVRREHVLDVSSNEFKVWLDFNLHKSIFFWSGTFYLKPYIIIFNDQTTGKVEGLVIPPGASPLVEAYNSTDTAYGVPNWSGGYLIRGMNPGTYSIAVMGHHGYNDTTLSNIVVEGGQTTKAPTATLHQ
jgi:hypothetical protein